MLEFKDWRPEDIQKIGAPTMVMIADGDIVRPEHAVEIIPTMYSHSCWNRNQRYHKRI